jgi:hypothetical protein
MVKFLKNIVIITLPALIVLLLILEIFFRFAIPAMERPRPCFDTEERIFKYCTDAGEGLATFGKFAQQRGSWRINNHGWNSPIDYREEKDRPRIAVIGDSYVEAFQVDADESYPSLMRAELGDRCDVYGFGISGAPLSEYLNISRYVNRHFDPDVFIINIRYNDFAESILEINPANTHMLMVSITDSMVTETVPRPNYSFSQFSLKRRLLRKSAIVRYLVINLKVQQAVHDLLKKQRYAGNIEIETLDKNMALVEVATAYIFRRLREENPGRRVIIVMAAPRHDIYTGTVEGSPVLRLNKLVASLASANGFELLDLAEPMMKDYEANSRPFNSPWDAHWNQYGHQFVARQVLSLGLP